MSVFVPKGTQALQVRCSGCQHAYDWLTNQVTTAFTRGEGLALQHRVMFTVRCPECGDVEAKWDLDAGHPRAPLLPFADAPS